MGRKEVTATILVTDEGSLDRGVAAWVGEKWWGPRCISHYGQQDVGCERKEVSRTPSFQRSTPGEDGDTLPQARQHTGRAGSGSKLGVSFLF